MSTLMVLKANGTSRANRAGRDQYYRPTTLSIPLNRKRMKKNQTHVTPNTLNSVCDRAARLAVVLSRNCRQVRRNCCSDIFAQHHSCAHRGEIQPLFIITSVIAIVALDDLHNDGKHRTDKHKQQYRTEIRPVICFKNSSIAGLELMSERCFQKIEPNKQQRKPAIIPNDFLSSL